MKLVELNIKEYSHLLSSDAPAPGGGAASALAGVQGIALTLMVINLTLGKDKYAEYQSLCMETKGKAEVLMKALLEGVDKDKEVFTTLSSAYKLPKETEEEKLSRSNAIAEATIGATEVPIAAMEQSLEALRLTLPLVGKSNQGAVSDLGAAAINLLSCIKGSWLNVIINLPGIKDKKLAGHFEAQGKNIFSEAEQLSDAIYKSVEKAIRG